MFRNGFVFELKKEDLMDGFCIQQNISFSCAAFGCFLISS